MIADKVICISKTTQQDIKDFYDIELTNSYVVPLAHSEVFVPSTTDNSSFQSQIRKPFMLYVGGRANYKNFQLLLQAYSHWPNRKDIDLVVVGADWSRIEKHLLAQYGITQEVRLITKAHDYDLCKLYNEAQAFIYPSLYEGFGIPLLEAMACNCPIIASKIPSTVEVAGNYPIYFEETKLESLICALDHAYNNSRATNFNREGADIARAYSWNNTASQILTIYKDLL